MHPQMLINHQNVIEWSAPFMIFQILQIFFYIFNGDFQEVCMDQYPLERIKEIDPNFQPLPELIPKIRQPSISSMVVPEEDSELQIPIVSNYRPS